MQRREETEKTQTSEMGEKGRKRAEGDGFGSVTESEEIEREGMNRDR